MTDLGSAAVPERPLALAASGRTASLSTVHYFAENGDAGMTNHMRYAFFLILLILPPLASKSQVLSTDSSSHDLRFAALAKTWDEGIPLGNGMLGALVWQNNALLRMSLDRADLWDLRPVKEFQRPEFRFAWVVEQALHGDYRLVQELGDGPYDRDPAPTKLPGAALEFSIPRIDEVEAAELRLSKALCTIQWKSKDA